MGAALWRWFLVGSEATLGSEPCLLGADGQTDRQGSLGAALWSWFLVGSEGNVRQWSLLARCRFRPSVPWCFAVSEPPAETSLWSCFEGMGAALWSWFLVGSEGNVRVDLAC